MSKPNAGLVPIFLRAAIAAAGVLFLLVGLLKANELQAFENAITSQALIPVSMVGTVAMLVVGAEILVGLVAIWGVLGGWMRTALASMALTLLLCAMTVYASLLWANPPPAPVTCGCIPWSPPVEAWQPIVVRNGAFTVLACLSTLAALRMRNAPKPEATAPIAEPA